MARPRGTYAAQRRQTGDPPTRGNRLLVGVFLLGLAVFLFPMVADAINAQTHTYSVRSYDERVAQLSEAERTAIQRSAEARNQELAGATPSISDPFPSASAGPEGVSHIDLRTLDEAIGHLEVPAIDLDLPVFEGDGEDVLQRGIGHIPNSSLPVGGDTTHSVLTAHRGLPTSTLFRNLDQVVVGDTFFVHTLGNTLAYRVVAIDIVLPSRFDVLRIQKGRDLVTLITCTPYMVNSHRLLVTGERIPYTEDLRPASPGLPTPVRGWLDEWGAWLLVLIAGTAFWFIVRSRRRRRQT